MNLEPGGVWTSLEVAVRGWVNLHILRVVLFDYLAEHCLCYSSFIVHLTSNLVLGKGLGKLNASS